MFIIISAAILITINNYSYIESVTEIVDLSIFLALGNKLIEGGIVNIL